MIGKGIEYLPYLIYVFTEMGKSGIGTPIHQERNRKRGGQFELLEVVDELSGKIIFDRQSNVLIEGHQQTDWQEAVKKAAGYQSSRLTLAFQTPVRIKQLHDKQSKLTGLASFSQIIVNLYWRMLMLSYFHCNRWSLDDDRFANLSQHAKEQRKQLAVVTDVKLTDNQTYWQDYTRRSNRQKTEMFLGGFMGKAGFEGNISPYLPMLTLGEHTHVGKQTMFGLGKYRIFED